MRRIILLLLLPIFSFAQTRQSGGISFTPQWNYKISGSDTTWQFGNTLMSPQQFPFILTKWQSDQRYAPIAGGGYVPTSRTLTIGTTTADLSANRTFLLGNLTNGVGIQSLTYDGTTSPTVKVDTANITSKTFFNTRIGTATAASIATKGTVTSITPGYGFTSSTPITTSGTITIDTTKITDLAHFNGKIGTGVATALAGKQATGNYITALTGEATAGGPGSVAITLSNSAVIGKVLTGFVSGAGTVAATDNILQAIQKLNGNIGALVTGVSSFNTRTGAITLTSSDVTTALTFTPENVANKATTYGTINNTLYPSIKLVSDSTLHPNKNLSDVVNKPTALVNLGAAPVGATMYIGTTAHTLNRASASEALTGITSIDGSAAKWTTGRTVSITGDIAYTSPSFDGSGNVTAAATLPTINSNVGSFNTLTVNGKGQVTAASNTSYENPLTFSTGLTRTTNTVTVNTSQNITNLTNLNTAGFVKTTGVGGALSIDNSTYLTGNQTISFAPTGDVTGSTTGTTTLAPVLTIGAAKVTNSMLAGSIDLTTKVTGLLPNANLANSTISGVSLGGTLAAHSVGYGLSGSNYTGTAIQTWTADTTSGGGLMSKARAAANYATITTVAGKAAVNSTTFIGTTSHTLNRSSASEALTGVTFPTAPTATDMPVRWQDTTRFLTKYALPNMLMIGNSLTYGTGSTSTDSTMTANLGRLTGRFVYNYGVPGETSTQIRTRFFALSGAMKQLPIIIEAGRNNYTDSATVIADISAMANYLISIHNNKFLIDAIPNASGEPFGNSGYDIIIATNVRLAKLFPGHFVDSRQALLGYGNGSGTDNTDIANSVIPTSLRSDNIHLNDKGYRTKAGIYMAYLSVLQGESSYTAGLSVSGSPGSGFQGVGVATFTLANGHGYIQNYNNFYPAVNLPLPLHIQSPASSSLGLIENGGTLNIGDPGIDASTTTQTFTWNASTNQVKRIARGQIASSGSTITVGSGSGTVIGANVNLDISATYPGQTSITTLGTVGTGTWNGTIIGSTKGGSGVNNAGTLTWGAGGTLGTNAYTSTAFNSGAGTANYFTGYTGTNTQSTSNGFQFDGSGNMFSTANGTAGGFWLASNNSTYTQGIQFASGNINLYSTNNRVNTNAVTTGLSFYSTSTVPTISLGAGATGTISIVGNNQDGTITFTGTYTSGDLAVITMSGSFAYPTKCTPVISGVGGTAGLAFGPTAAGSTSTGWRIGGGGAIPVSTTVAWNYHNGGY